MRDLYKSLLEYDKKLLFILLCLLTFLLLLTKKVFIESEIAAFEVLEQKGEMGFFHLINGLQYIGIPLMYLYKFTIIAFVIWIGCFMFGYKLTYQQLWGVALISEFVFLIPEIFKIGWFFFFVGDPDYFNLSAFYPFSLLQLFDYTSLHPKWIYPLKALNIFEAFYWIALVAGVHYSAKKRKSIAYYIVFSSYVLMFGFWLLYWVNIYK